MKIPAYIEGPGLHYYSKGKTFFNKKFASFAVISKYSIIQSISFEQIILQAILICPLISVNLIKCRIKKNKIIPLYLGVCFKKGFKSDKNYPF